MLVEQIVKLFCPKWALNLYGKREESVHVCAIMKKRLH
jgi:hypothetical protein